jgi:RluA family pseudouridine synthase
VLRDAIDQGRLRVNGEASSHRRPLRLSDRVTVEGVFDPGGAYPTPRPEALFEDDQVLVVNKPAGCTVVRVRWERACAFVDGVLAYLRRARGQAHPRFRPRPVHRLDRDTTGAVILALTPEAEKSLCEQFRRRAVKKEYLSLVRGAPHEADFTIEAAIEEDPADPKRMAIARQGGKPSRTACAVLESFRGCCLLLCRPLTGRRHQVRLHLAYAGLPVVADPLYGGGEGLFLSAIKPGYKAKPDRAEPPLIGRCALHAAAVEFVHPWGRTVRVEAPMPNDFERALKALRRWAGRDAGKIA